MRLYALGHLCTGEPLGRVGSTLLLVRSELRRLPPSLLYVLSRLWEDSIVKRDRPWRHREGSVCVDGNELRGAYLEDYPRRVVVPTVINKCDACSRRYVLWMTDTPLWEAIIPKERDKVMLCVRCFRAEVTNLFLQQAIDQAAAGQTAATAEGPP